MKNRLLHILIYLALSSCTSIDQSPKTSPLEYKGPQSSNIHLSTSPEEVIEILAPILENRRTFIIIDTSTNLRDSNSGKIKNCIAYLVENIATQPVSNLTLLDTDGNLILSTESSGSISSIWTYSKSEKIESEDIKAEIEKYDYRTSIETGKGVAAVFDLISNEKSKHERFSVIMIGNRTADERSLSKSIALFNVINSDEKNNHFIAIELTPSYLEVFPKDSTGIEMRSILGDEPFLRPYKWYRDTLIKLSQHTGGFYVILSSS